MSDLMDSFRLDGKVALVTGATYGIGMAIAEALGEAGAKIAFNARHADKVAEAEKHYRELGFDAHGYVADVTDETVVAELIAKIEADFGTTPDILVNNAGVIQRTPMLDMSAEDFRRVVDIDLNAPFIVSKACLPGMIAKGHGKIINICSMMSELGRETIAGYAAAKGGLKMLTKNICSEFGEANIQCNGIGPGYIATPQTAPLRETLYYPFAGGIDMRLKTWAGRPLGHARGPEGPRRVPGFRRVELRQRPHPLRRRRHPRIHWKAASISVTATAHIRFHPLVFHLSCGEIRIGFGFYQAKQSVFHRKLEIGR